MSVTAATDTTLPDGRAVCVIRAYQLQPGDIWVEANRIDMRITHVSRHPLKQGWVIAGYQLGNSEIEGERSKALTEFVSILPRVETTQNGAH